MTEKIQSIPARMKNIAKGGHVAGTEDIIDDVSGKTQKEINTETGTEISGLKTKDTNLDNRLSTVEQLAEISVEGGDIGIGTTADFESDDPSDLAKVPTVGAMLGGANDGVYDISARHNGTKYADLSAALGTNGANVPVGVRKGGMSIKFVCTSDNKYVQYRLMSDTFSTDVTQWQGVDDKPIDGSHNLVESGGTKTAIDYVAYKADTVLKFEDKTTFSGYVASGDKIYIRNNAKSVIIKVNGGDSYHVKAPTGSCCGAFLKSLPEVFSDNLDLSSYYATGSGRIALANGGVSNGTVHSDAKYLLMSMEVNGTNWTPAELSVGGYDLMSSAFKKIVDLTNRQSIITGQISQINNVLPQINTNLGEIDVVLPKTDKSVIKLKHGLINIEGVVDPSNTSWIYTDDFISVSDIPEGSIPTWYITPTYPIGTRYYDENKDFLSSTYSSSAKYVRLIINTSDIDYSIEVKRSYVASGVVHESYYVATPYKKVIGEDDIDPIQYVANFGGIKLIEIKCGSVSLSSIKKVSVYRAFVSGSTIISGFSFKDASDNVLIDGIMSFATADEAKNYFNLGFIDLPQLKMLYENVSDTWNIGYTITIDIPAHYTPIIDACTYNINENNVETTPAETGKFINSSGNVTTSSGSLEYTEPIQLAAGETIRIYCKASNIVSVLSAFDGSSYQPLIIGINGTTLYEYKAETDMLVVLSFNYSTAYYASISKNISSRIKEEAVSLDFIPNCYVMATGIIYGTAANYGTSNPVKVYKGDVVDLTITASSGVTSVLNLSDFGGRNLVPVQVATASSATYHYVVEETGYIVISGSLSPAPILKITHGEFYRNFNNDYKDTFGYEEFYRKKHYYVDDVKYIPEMYGTIYTYEAESSVNSNHIVNAVAYPDGTIIACRDGGNVVKIENSGNETTLLTIANAHDWRGVFIDHNNNVYVSPHSSTGPTAISISDRGLYKLTYGESQFVKVISLYDTSSDIETETQSNDDTIWTMCEDNMGNLYAGVYAHSVRANPAIYKSTDGGDTWEYIFNFIDAGLTPVDDPRGRPMHIHCIVFNPYDCALYCIIGEIETVFKSTNGGTAWVDLHTNTEDTKGTTLIGVPDGLLIGSDGTKEGVLSKLYADDKTVKSVGRMWHAEFMGMRRSDVTGWIYAFTKIESTVKTTAYPPYAANSSTEALNEWKGDVTPGIVKNWELYNSWVSKFYNHDAIHPCSAAILVSRDNGESWEIIWSKDCGGYANGIWCIGYFRNGECLCGVTTGNSSNMFTNPVIVKEGCLDYNVSGVDLTKTVFGKIQ